MLKKSLLFAILVLILVFVGSKVEHFFQIDSCLDMGGKWDYTNNVCVYK